MAITPNDPANFTPVRGSYKELSPFRFWCQKVLPLVYDDSLSYYELLNKVVNYLNITMEDVGTLEDDVTNLHTAYVQLETYVNDYFVSLDVQEEINNKLDEMAENGELNALIDPLLPDLISAWLDEHLTETTPTIDDTLTIRGAGADAKVVGDLIKNLIINHGDILNNANKFVAPYNDFDTFTQNECVLITTNPANYVANVPNGFTSGWVLTFNYKNVATGGLVQIVFYATSTVKGRIAWRKKWGSTWDTWYYFDNTTDLLTAINDSISAVSADANSKLVMRGYNEVTNVAHPNLTDANNAEVNRIYSIQAGNVCANLPESKQGSLITFNYKDTGAGKIQFFHASSGTLYSRIYWVAWGEWIKYATTTDVETTSNNIQETLTNKIQEIVNTAYKGLGNFIACGDSITRSLSYPTQGSYVVVKSWASSFAELCGSNTTIYARGGRTTADFIASEDYPTAVADTSQYAFLFLGINDINNGVSVANFKTNYTTIVNALLTNHDFVLCINIPACLQPSASLTNYNEAISEVCDTVSNAFLVDITEASTRLNVYKNYGHLSSIGYAMLAGEIAKAVNLTMADNSYFTTQIDADNNA